MILVFGSISLDTVYQLPSLPLAGGTVIGATAHTVPGGKGANQAVAAARDGAMVAIAGAVGRDHAATAALEGLTAAGVDISRVARVDIATATSSVCIEPGGQTQIAIAAGANLAARADQVADADLTPDTILLLQMETSPVENAILIRRARAAGATIILNLAPAKWIAEDALHGAHWVVVNRDEAGWLGEHLGGAANAASLQAALGGGVVRTRGVQGMEAVAPDIYWRCDSLDVEAVDSTGAGDCFVGVFAAELDRRTPLPEALRRANVASALSCLQVGNQTALPNRAEIDAAMKNAPVVTDQQPEMAD